MPLANKPRVRTRQGRHMHPAFSVFLLPLRGICGLEGGGEGESRLPVWAVVRDHAHLTVPFFYGSTVAQHSSV